MKKHERRAPAAGPERGASDASIARIAQAPRPRRIVGLAGTRRPTPGPNGRCYCRGPMRSPAAPRTRPRGIALILALLVLTLLVVVVGQLAYTTRIDLQVAGNATDGQQALYAAWGGIEYAKALLRDDVQRNKHDGPADRWARLSKPVKVGDVQVKVTVEDEERKLNLLLLASEHEVYSTWATDTLKRLIAVVREASEDAKELPPDQLAENIATWLREGRKSRTGTRMGWHSRQPWHTGR